MCIYEYAADRKLNDHSRVSCWAYIYCEVVAGTIQAMAYQCWHSYAGNTNNKINKRTHRYAWPGLVVFYDRGHGVTDVH